MKNKPVLNKKEAELYKQAEKILKKSPILYNQSSACRRAWCEGFMNGKLYFDHLKPKKRFYEFWK